jgi:hypothetical protein
VLGKARRDDSGESNRALLILSPVVGVTIHAAWTYVLGKARQKDSGESSRVSFDMKQSTASGVGEEIGHQTV